MAVDNGSSGERREAMETARVQIPRALQALKGAARLSDQRLGDLMGMSRSAVQARLSGETDISQQELVGFAVVLQTDVCAIFELAARLPPVNHRYPEQPPLPIFADAAA